MQSEGRACMWEDSRGISRHTEDREEGGKWAGSTFAEAHGRPSQAYLQSNSTAKSDLVCPY